MPNDQIDSRLWRASLGTDSVFQPAEARERFSVGLAEFRRRAAALAAEIPRDLPEMTVHDVSHLDALWVLADLVAGDEWSLNPAEAFVLGGAILVHDLAMSLAAYPDASRLRDNPFFLDTLAREFRIRHGRAPSTAEQQNPPDDVLRAATSMALRELHAEQAERLPLEPFRSPSVSDPLYLIDDTELRLTYGHLIGQLAASHWWGSHVLAQQFPGPVGAPYFAQATWTVDPLSVACVLRTIDAAHLDAARAPLFLSALRRPGAVSLQHWTFQQHLHQPYRQADRLIYTTARPFSADEADAWWLCLDSLRVVDRELRSVDAVLADNSRDRLAARGVAYVDDPRRLADHVQTDGWEPVDARLHVGDVVSLIDRFGKEGLYGRDTTVPLRELVMNGCDAVRALAVIRGTAVESFNGRIEVRLVSTPDGPALEVRDNGIGMPLDVLTGPLLDFGSSFWDTAEASRLYPGLQSKGFVATGTYGIGFFAGFMLGNCVTVTSRAHDEAAANTHVLKFDGLNSRPLARKAGPDEVLHEGGTIVSVQLAEHAISNEQVLLSGNVGWVQFHRADLPLDIVLPWLFPTAEIDIHLRTAEGTASVVKADDWRELDAAQLLRRSYLQVDDEDNYDDVIDEVAANVRDLVDDVGEVVGRAAILTNLAWRRVSTLSTELTSVVTVGGARSQTGVRGVAGVFLGRSLRVARDSAIPLAWGATVRHWAEAQAELLMDSFDTPEAEAEAAEVVVRLGGTSDLRLFQTGAGWLTSAEARNWIAGLDQIRIAHPLYLREGTDAAVELDHDVVVLEVSHTPGLVGPFGSMDREWPINLQIDDHYEFPNNNLPGHLLSLAGDAWGCVFSPRDAFDREVRTEIATVDGRRLRAPATVVARPDPR